LLERRGEKLPSKKEKKATSKKSKVSLKKENSARKRKSSVQTSKAKNSRQLGSYETWLEKQVKEWGKRPAEHRSQGPKKMPVNTFDLWLKSQRAVEKQTRGSFTPPRDTYEEWMRKQVAQRQSTISNVEQENQRATGLDNKEVANEELQAAA
jgi:hypothetical protein